MQMAAAQGITADKMEEATKGAIGLSKAFGINSRRAILGISNAMQGQFTTLQRYIPELRTAETEAEKMAIVQEKMAAGFEVAKAEADNGYGAMQQLNNAVGDYKETLGQSIAEGMKPFTEWLTRIVSEATEARIRLLAINDLLGKGIEVDEKAVEALGLEELRGRLDDAKQSLQELADAEGAGATARREKIKSLIESLQSEIEQRKIIQEYADKGAEAAEERAKAEEKVRKELERQKELNQTAAERREQIREEYGKKLELLNADSSLQREMLEIEQDRREAIAKANEDYVRTGEEIQLINEYYDQLRENAKAAAEEAALEKQKRDQKELQELLKERQEQEKRLAEQRKQLHREELRRQREYITSTINGMADLFSQIGALRSAQTSRAVDELERKKEAELAALEEGKLGEEEYAEKKEAIEEKYQKKRAQLKYKGELAAWRMNLASAIAKGAEAVISGYATNPFLPVGLAAGTLAATLTALEIAALQASKPQPPQLAAGGVIQSETAAIVGEAGREAVLPLEDERAMEAIREGLRGGAGPVRVTVNLGSKTLYDDISRATENGEIIVSPRSVR
jgi:hypothetical protein